MNIIKNIQIRAFKGRMCFDKVLTSSAVVMTMELRRGRMNWKSEKGFTAEAILSRFHHPGREVGFQCREIFKNHRSKYLMVSEKKLSKPVDDLDSH